MRSPLHAALRKTARRGLERLLALPAVRGWLSRRALDAWERADSVAFVCFGNICRSPFAEAVARERAPGRTLLSAGSAAKPGRRSPAQAVLSAGAWNVDLRPHRSQLFSPELAAGADAVFVFDVHNLRKVLMAHPRALKRVHPLGALTSVGSLFISDPYGGDAATFDRTFEQIAAAIPGALIARAGP
jgi:protein-tyrosine phosphatase